VDKLQDACVKFVGKAWYFVEKLFYPECEDVLNKLSPQA